MKKMMVLALCLVLALSLVACGEKTQDATTENEMASLFEQEYEMVQTSLMNYTFTALFMKNNDYNDAYKAIVKMDEETYDKLLQCDTFEEEGLKNLIEIVTSLPDCVVTSMSEELPKEGELEEYIGKTVKDMDDAGYERNGYYLAEDGCIFYADGPKFSVTIQTEEIITPEEMGNYLDNDFGNLTIKSIEFNGFSNRILD